MKVKVGRGRTVELTILPLSQVIPHEETNSSLLKQVLSGLSEIGLQKDPILVDSNSRVILDGMHRRAALQKIGAKFVLCALYDYSDREIELHRWLRCVRNPDSELTEIVSRLFQLVRSSKTDALRKLNGSKSGFVFVERGSWHFSQNAIEPQVVYSKIAEFDRLTKKSSIIVEFIKDSQVSNYLRREYSVLLPVALSKSGVVTIAKSGKMLPYKTTRHIVPFRPVGVPYPLKALRELDFEENLELLQRTIPKCAPRVLRSGSEYDNRVFEEQIVSFT